MRHNGMLKAVCCAAVALATSAAARAVTLTPVELPRPEGARHYLLAVPDAATPAKRPLVILLHGHAGSAAQLLGRERSAAPMSLWLRIADREGVLLAAPDGAVGRDGRRGWNDCRGDAANNPQVDDVGLVTDIIHREVEQHGADPSRVFVMGMSNGGMMALRLAIELGSTLAGFAAVSASMAAHTACPVPNVPVSALIVAGTHDPLVPYAGGDVHLRSSHPRGAVIGVESAAATWRDTIGLPAAPASVATLPHRDAADATRATRIVWGERANALQVELLRIDGGGHIEPSITQRARRAYTAIVGAQNGDVEVAEEAWNFFKDKRAGMGAK